MPGRGGTKGPMKAITTMKRYFYFLLACFLTGFAADAEAKYVIDDGGIYRVVFNRVGKGGMAEGALHASGSALLHMQNGTWDDIYWRFGRRGDNTYSLRNMQTDRYVSLGSEGPGKQPCAVLTETLRGDSSLWRIEESNGAFIASNAADTAYRLRVYSMSYRIDAEKADKPSDAYCAFKLYNRHGEKLLPMEQRRKNVASFFDVLSFGGARPVFDGRNELLLLPVDVRQKDRAACHLQVNYVAPPGMNLLLNGQKLRNGSTVALTNSVRGRTFRLTLKADTGVVAESHMTVTFMPVIEITGTGFSKENYVAGSFRITDGEYLLNNDSLYGAAIRYRGNSTAGMQKKGYAVKLTDGRGQSLKRSLHGLRTDNYWVFDPMSVDHARLRNPSSFMLWNKYAADCYYAAEEPDRQKASRGFFAEVLLNGSYIGIYNIMEKSDRKQFKLKKEQPAQTGTEVRGVMYKGNGWTGAVKMTLGYSVPSFDNTRTAWDGWESVYPDIEEGQRFDWSPLADAVRFVCTSKDKDFIDGIWTYFDRPVMVDYYLLLELMQGYDNMGKNILYMAHNIKKSRMLTIAPWDMDGTWGRDWDGRINARQDPATDADSRLNSLNGLYRRLAATYPGWKEMEARRYRELRGSYFSEDSLLAIFNGNFDLFAASAADRREEKRWDGKDNLSLDLEEERAYLNKWIPRRLAALDKKYGYEASGIAGREAFSDYAVEVVPGGLTFQAVRPAAVDVFAVTGRLVRRIALRAGKSTVDLPPGIYIVGKKKYSVK